jgi:hypothetical protein
MDRFTLFIDFSDIIGFVHTETVCDHRILFNAALSYPSRGAEGECCATLASFAPMNSLAMKDLNMNTTQLFLKQL